MPASAIVASNLPEMNLIDASAPTQNSPALIEAASPSEIKFPCGKTFIAKVNAPIGAPLECQVISNAIGQPTDYRMVVFQSWIEGKLQGQLQLIEDSPPIGSKAFLLAISTLMPSSRSRNRQAVRCIYLFRISNRASMRQTKLQRCELVHHNHDFNVSHIWHHGLILPCKCEAVVPICSEAVPYPSM